MGSTLHDGVGFLKYVQGILDFLLSKLHISQMITSENLVQRCGCLVGFDLRTFMIPGQQHYHLTIWYDTVPVFNAHEMWVTYMHNVFSNKTILFDNLDF